jgi:hypothetical protein
MSTTGIIAGVVALPHGGKGRELATGTRTEFVDGASGLLTHLSAQGDTARWLTGSALHAGHSGRDDLDQTRRHYATGKIIGLAAIEGNSVSGAARATGDTGINCGICCHRP